MSVTLKDIDKARDVRAEIHPYLKECCDEYTEACVFTGNLLSFSDMIDESLWRALFEQHCAQLMYFKENTKWIERKETITRKVVELEFTDR